MIITEPTAFFDFRGRCVMIATSGEIDESTFTAHAPVAEGTVPDTIWHDGKAVKPTEEAVFDLPTVLPVGEELTITVPADTTLLVDGQPSNGVIKADTPKRMLLQFVGRKQGIANLTVGDYGQLRAAEYPLIADQLDALWKGGAEEAAMRQRIAAVKAKYPKP